jgi:hypothetical protein
MTLPLGEAAGFFFKGALKFQSAVVNSLLN